MSGFEANLDGELHVACDEDCCEGIMKKRCPTCGGKWHSQPIYGGMMYVCEDCPADADVWKPRGTFKTDCMVDLVGDGDSDMIGVPGSFVDG